MLAVEWESPQDILPRNPRCALTSMSFVHLHCHTDYSLLDGACEIDQLMNLVAAQKMPAVAMTDHGNLFGAVKFYNAAKANGVHPVIGCEVYVSQQGHKTRSDTDRYNHLVLLCQNQEGYKNLIDLVSTAYLDGFVHENRRIAKRHFAAVAVNRWHVRQRSYELLKLGAMNNTL